MASGGVGLPYDGPGWEPPDPRHSVKHKPLAPKHLGQLITFAVEQNAWDASKFTWEHARKGDTCRIIAGRFGHPEAADLIRRMNGISSTTKKLKPGRKLKIPKALKEERYFRVLADDSPPNITGGYAKLQVVDRPANVGYDQFMGYDPVSMDVPVQFLSYPGFRTGSQVERDIAILESFGGRGVHSNHGSGPPPTIRLTTTDGQGKTVPLIPANYQWSSANAHAPLWRVAGISWDANPLRHTDGTRRLQKAVVTVWQTTPFSFKSRSVAERRKRHRTHQVHPSSGGAGLPG